MICAVILPAVAAAQEKTPEEPGGDDSAKARERVARTAEKDQPPAPVETADDSDDTSEIEAYYTNYMKIYRLGPADVITVRVFGQCPDYCRENLTIPPTARISYPLIRGGIFVAGKTIQQLEAEITKKLDEYIIDPDVTVELVKVGSARYNVLGRVANPGEHFMTRRVSIFDAIAAAGGISEKGDKKRVLILRPNARDKMDGIVVNLKDIEEGRAEMAYLNPGDQVLVPKQGFNFKDIPSIIGQVSIFRFLFGSPF